MPLFPRLRDRIEAHRAAHLRPTVEDYEEPIAPASTRPLRDYLIRLAITRAANRLKGLPMLTGYKTYITAALMLALAGASILGVDINGFSADPGTLIMSAIGLIFARTGAKTEVAKKL